MRTRFVACLGLAALLLPGGPAWAIGFDLVDGELYGSFDTTVTLGTTFRVAERDSNLVGKANGGSARSINGDNGNLNYDAGDVTSASARVTHELEANYDRFSFFARGYYFYDLAIREFDTQRTELGDTARRLAGMDAELLDLYLVGDFDVADRPLTLRAGNQVISWGESTFIQNGINAINPVDVTQFRVAGAELRNGLIPIPAIDAELGLTDNLSLEAFYQVTWDHTEIEPEGTFFSTNDFASRGGRRVFLGFGQPPVTDNPPLPPGANPPVGTSVPRSRDDDASDNGQWGVAARLFSPELNNSEFGLYYLRYHSRLPLVSAVTGTVEGAGAGDYAESATYFREFPEDIELIGASFNTEIGATGIAVQGEASYKFDQPLQVDDVELLFAALSPLGAFSPQLGIFNQSQLVDPERPFEFGQIINGYRRKDVVQWQATFTSLLGPTAGTDQLALVAEVGGTHVPDLERKSELRYEGPGTFTSGNDFFTQVGVQPGTQNNGFADDFSWGYRILLRSAINSAIGSINLQPTLAFAHDVEGTTPSPIGNFIEGRKAVTVAMGATYLNAWQFVASYTNSFDGGTFNLVKDRDFVTASLSYSF